MYGKPDTLECAASEVQHTSSIFYYQLPAKHAESRMVSQLIYVLDPTEQKVFTRSHCELEGIGFLLTITSAQTGKSDRAAMVSCAYELQHYMTAASDVEISHVQMLCPPALTRSDRWSLVDLDQITCYQGVTTEETAVVYRTAQGVYKIGALDLRLKKTTKVWFSKKRLANHRPRISESHRTASAPRMYAPLYLKTPSTSDVSFQ